MKLKFIRLDYQQRVIEKIFEVLHGTNINKMLKVSLIQN